MEKGFTKIELPTTSQPDTESEQGRIMVKKTSRIPKSLGIIVVSLLLLLIILGVAVFFTGKDFYFSAQKTGQIAQEAYVAFKNKDIELAKTKLSETKKEMEVTKQKLAPLSWMKFIPILGTYERDVEHFVDAGLAGVDAAQIAADTVIPYADLLGFKGKSTFVAGSADERIRTAVETLDKMTPKLDDIGKKIVIVKDELDQVDADRYPEKIGAFTLRSRLQSAKNIFSQSAKLFVDAQPVLKETPDLLGLKSPKRYLLIFQNDAELRATGGFITAYALFSIDKGKMQVERSDDIYRLDAAKGKTLPAPDKILSYHLKVNTFELRDSNLSPDYPTSMKQFESMLSSVPGFPSYDGIIALDTHVLVSAIKILGDFNIGGRTYSAENDKRCDCPKAIYELEDYSTRPVAYVREERKDQIGTLMYQIMQRSLGVSPSKYWGQLFQMFLNEANQKHILFYLHNSTAQKGIEALNWAGAIKPYDGDYLHVSNVNFAGAKSNLFVKQAVKQEITVGGDGSIEKKVTISYKNPYQASNCNLEAGQLCLNGILRNWLRLFVPQGATLLDFKGSEAKVQTYTDLGKTVFEGFLKVNPQGSAEVTVRYKLPFKADAGKPYKLLIQKQPGTDEDQYTVTYNGKQVYNAPLLSDTEISVK